MRRNVAERDRSLGADADSDRQRVDLLPRRQTLSPCRRTHAWRCWPSCSPFSAAALARRRATAPLAAREHGATRASRRATTSSPTPTARWLKATEIPAGKERWSARNEIDELTRRSVAQLLDDAAHARRPGSLARKVADFRAAYLNEAAIEARGIAPLQPLLDRIDARRRQGGAHPPAGPRHCAPTSTRWNWGVYDSSHAAGPVGGARASTARRPTSPSCCRAGWACRTASTT